jgi:predicted transcriptional regulator
MKRETLEEKWGNDSMSMGWTAIPTLLLFLQSDLKISPLGLNIILNLVSHWWDSEENPYPSQESLAKRMGVSKRSVQREVANLVSLGLIEKRSTKASDNKYKGRNTYDLTNLVKILNDKKQESPKKTRRPTQKDIE